MDFFLPPLLSPDADRSRRVLGGCLKTSPATAILSCSSDGSPRRRGSYFRQSISFCAALCILQQATGTLADLGCAGSADSPLTSRCQPCSAGLQRTSIGKGCPPQGSVSSYLPREEGSPRGGGERGRFSDKDIPHLNGAQTSSPGKAGRGAGVWQGCRNPLSNEKSQHGKGHAAPPEPNTPGMQLKSPSTNISSAGRTSTRGLSWGCRLHQEPPWAEMHKHSFQPQLCTKPTNKVRARALLNAKLTRSSVWGELVPQASTEW